MYNTTVSSQKYLLREQSKNLDHHKLSQIAPGVHLVSPGNTKVAVLLGANTLIGVVVTGHTSHEVSRVWLEWNGSSIEDHLDTSLGGYHKEFGVVFFHKPTMQTSRALFYECRIRVLNPPPGDSDQVMELLPLQLHVAGKVRMYPTSDEGDRWEAQQKAIVETLPLNFPVKL